MRGSDLYVGVEDEVSGAEKISAAIDPRTRTIVPTIFLAENVPPGKVREIRFNLGPRKRLYRYRAVGEVLVGGKVEPVLRARDAVCPKCGRPFVLTLGMERADAATLRLKIDRGEDRMSVSASIHCPHCDHREDL